MEPKLKISYISTAQYINSQRLFLRRQFILPLRNLVLTVHRCRSLSEIKPLHIAFESVQIKLNRQFSDAHRTKLLFLDILASERKADGPSSDVELNKAGADQLSKLKLGTLLCLSSGYDFNDLILATVVDTDVRRLHRGYVWTLNFLLS